MLKTGGCDWTEIAGLPRLNVFRAVAEALLDRDGKAVVIDCAHCAVGAVAPARMRLQAEDTHLRAGVQIFDERIARSRNRPNTQGVRIRRLNKTWLTRDNRCPGLARAIDRTDEHEGQ